MIGEKYLGKEYAEDLFKASEIASLITEKQACEIVGLIEKDAGVIDYLKNLGKGIVGAAGVASGALEKGVGAASKIPSMLMWTAGLGGGLGALGATGYDVIKERLSGDDPESKFNSEVEAIYANKVREENDARWISRVRKMRDELIKGYKKMAPKEYAKKYRELIDALDERSM